MTQKRTPKVNEVKEFLEIASDFENPLELVREALSNSYDADATSVSIEISPAEGGKADIIIEDNGQGMDESDLECFFDLGNSQKEEGIGYKGHGTKIYYKSDRISVEAVSEGFRTEAQMLRPWECLNNEELPEYEVKTARSNEESYTRIHVEGFQSGVGFDPENLTYNKIHHYIKWKTIGGSTAHYFEDDFHEMNISVELADSIDDTQDVLEMTNRFEFPPENLDPEGEFVTEEMCKVYPPMEITVEADDRSIPVQIVGMVAGKKARNKLPTYGKHSAQFGVWVAKDHIKVERANEAISHDNEFFHFLFVANCQAIELSANREKIRNKTSDVYQQLVKKLDIFMSRVCADPWYQDYIEKRKIEHRRRSLQRKSSNIQDRQQKIQQRDGLNPKNPVEVVALLERYSANGAATPITLEDFQSDEPINAIVKVGKDFETAAIEAKLSDFFEEENEPTHIDRFICWKVGDIDLLREIEREGHLGHEIAFDFENAEVHYLDSAEDPIPILELSSVLEDRYGEVSG